MRALAALVEDRGSLVDAAQLHGVKVELRIAAFGTWLVNLGVLFLLYNVIPAALALFIVREPSWLGFGRGPRRHLGQSQVRETYLVRAKRTVDHFPVRRL